MFPILFEFGRISIQTLWVFVAIALLVASYLAVKRLKRRRVNFNLFIEHSGFMLISAIFFSRLFYFFTNTNAYFPRFDLRTLWNFLSIWDQGLSFWGGLIGLFIMLTYYILKAKEDLWKWYDSLSVPILVGLMIGNVGAFLGGYAYGTPTSLPWGVSYEAFTVKYTVPIHPIQIYAIILIGLILWSKNRLKTKTDFFETDGNTSLYLITGFSLISFLLEFIRGDDTLLIFGYRLPILFFFIAFAISGYLLLRRCQKVLKSKKS